MSFIQNISSQFKKSKLDPVQFTEECFSIIDASNPEINAFNDVDRLGAISSARASQNRYSKGEPLSLLDGIPIAVKSCLATKNLPYTGGICGFKKRISKSDAHVVSKLRQAGAVILGTTNMDEGGIGAICDNPSYGRTQNPLTANFTPGGSSGGAAASVASGMAVAAVAIDTLGDIRVPASYCGVSGFKPSRNLLETKGLLPLSWTLDTIGTISKSPMDCFIVTAGMLGIQMNPNKIPQDISGMKIGIPWDLLDQSEELEDSVRSNFEQAIKVFSSLGVQIVPVALPGYDIAQLRLAAWLVCEAEAAEFHLDDIRDNPEYFSDNFMRMMQHGLQASDPIKVEALTKVASMGDVFSNALLGVDAIITPTTPTKAFKFGSQKPIGQNDFTLAANLVGAPSVSVPIPNSSAAGLPHALQITVDGLGERKAITIANAFENAIKHHC